ncbi:hypothetical protein ACFLW8_06175 [Chloroflexota bacterium]
MVLRKSKTPSELMAEHAKWKEEFRKKALAGQARWGAWWYDPKNLTLDIRTEMTGSAKYISYSVDLERCNNSSQILDWLLQMSGKAWCSKEQIGYLLQAIHDLADLYGVIGNSHFNMGEHLSRKGLRKGVNND